MAVKLLANLAIFLSILRTLTWLFLMTLRACVGDFDFLYLATLKNKPPVGPADDHWGGSFIPA